MGYPKRGVPDLADRESSGAKVVQPQLRDRRPGGRSGETDKMPSDDSNVIAVDGLRVDLRNRLLAAVLAWLMPGAGHFYQRRYAKGGLFFVCILTTWVIGFVLGGGHVVYASWQPGDKRWHYLLQVGVGVPALPALVQGERMRRYTDDRGQTRPSYRPLWGGFMAPPFRPVDERAADEVSAWYARFGAGYEMGTWYTVIAGLLNILVIYDAYGGPLAVPISGRRKEDEAAGPSADDKQSGERDPPDV
jgi:TM2 domain-containing membrane protein YozV